MKNILLFTSIVSIVLSVGCGGKRSVQPSIQTVPQDSREYPMPTAYELTRRINQAGAAFVIGITNPAGGAEKYFTAEQKALNIGIYGADLAYVNTYNMEQETRDYLQALHTLTGSLDINTNFNADLVRKVEDNINNKDTVIGIITQSFRETYNFLVNNGRDDISLFVLAGTWIEGMYITAYLATTSARNDTMLNILFEQKESLVKLLSLLDEAQNEELQKITQELVVFEAFLTLPADAPSAKYSAIRLNNATAFREKIEKLRSAIVN